MNRPMKFKTYLDNQGVYRGPEVWDYKINLSQIEGVCSSLGTMRVLKNDIIGVSPSVTKDFGNLEKVEGSMLLSYSTNLKSLGKIKTIGVTGDFEGCSMLEDLGALETVGESIDFTGCAKLQTLGLLRDVGEDLTVARCKTLLSLGESVKVNGTLTVDNPYLLLGLNESQFKNLRVSSFGKPTGLLSKYYFWNEIKKIEEASMTELPKFLGALPWYFRPFLERRLKKG